MSTRAQEIEEDIQKAAEEIVNLRRLRLFKYFSNNNDNDEENKKVALDKVGLIVLNIANSVHRIIPYTQKEAIDQLNIRYAYPFEIEELNVAIFEGQELDRFLGSLDKHLSPRNVHKLANEIFDHFISFFAPNPLCRDKSFSLVICADVYRDLYHEEYLDRINNSGGLICNNDEIDKDNLHDVITKDVQEVVSDDEDDCGNCSGDGCDPFGGPRYGVEVSMRCWTENLKAEMEEVESLFRLEEVDDVSEGEDGEKIECSICLAPFEAITKGDYSQHRIRLECDHVFHKGCLLKWLPKIQSCPYCRSNTVVGF
ncbi:hypothetical protein RND81_14G059100 [Saponaria officinalis]|uniref:RING-type domain-containing protein n=1 Tax=Saponaria officinalis TaxID=3572 RepID=A0AAW1GUT3_SAPOF